MYVLIVLEVKKTRIKVQDDLISTSPGLSLIHHEQPVEVDAEKLQVSANHLFVCSNWF